MHLLDAPLARRVQGAFCALAVTAGLMFVPSLAGTANATDLPPAPMSCSAAKALWKKSGHLQNQARLDALKAAKRLAKATATHQGAKTRAALKASAVKAAKHYRSLVAATKVRHTKMGEICSAENSAAKAFGAGKKLALLAVANGLDLSAINTDQLTALLEDLLPGVTDHLTDGQLTALLNGFNAASALSPTDVLALFGGLFSTDQVTAILGGLASPEVLTSLVNSLVGQLSGMGGGLPIPGGLDLSAILETVTGILGSDGGLSTLCGLVPIPVLCG
ncbi:hypothetical protein [Nocardioides marmorisolisilvae]|uniref:Uncharacterized protein n=1 Tax=Nocardioides marmorisolisilvae TaxID=1542737 RepID=A0A3N0DQQ2_9ACTN|nr:hypothetical protein [Nocardioides marmorisolisilvae]RNL77673.1 hypothetical protein EFL95_16845 [Nocardioides marmorisolisilvae]